MFALDLAIQINMVCRKILITYVDLTDIINMTEQKSICMHIFTYDDLYKFNVRLYPHSNHLLLVTSIAIGQYCIRSMSLPAKSLNHKSFAFILLH